MTCPIVERLDALHAKATPGEWWADGGEIRSVGKDDYDPVLFEDGASVSDTKRARANAETVVALHNAWPAISAVLKAAEAMPDRSHAIEWTAYDAALLDAVRALRAMEAG